MKTLKPLILLLFSLGLLFTACSKDDDNTDQGNENNLSFVSNADIEFYKSQRLTLELKYEEEFPVKEFLKLYVDDFMLTTFDMTVGTNNRVIIDFKLPVAVSHPYTGKVKIDYKGKLIQGPKVVLFPSYSTGYLTAKVTLGALNMQMASLADGMMKTVIDQSTQPAPVTFIANGFDQSGEADITYNKGASYNMPTLYGDFNQVLQWPFTFRQGMDVREDITYFYSLYRKSGEGLKYLVMQEGGGNVLPVGYGNYDQNFGGHITEIHADANLNLYVMENSKPNCIYKMSALQAPSLWAGSATEAGSVDGKGTAARFQNVKGLQMDSKNNLYVAQDKVIRKISTDGTVTTLSNFQFGNIEGFAIAPDDRLYILDATERNKIKVIDAQQTGMTKFVILQAGSESVKEADIYSNNISVSTDGIVYYRTYQSATKQHVLNILKLD